MELGLATRVQEWLVALQSCAVQLVASEKGGAQVGAGWAPSRGGWKGEGEERCCDEGRSRQRLVWYRLSAPSSTRLLVGHYEQKRRAGLSRQVRRWKVTRDDGS